jgi:hypothetical protein
MQEFWKESAGGFRKVLNSLRLGEVATFVSEPLKSRSHAVMLARGSEFAKGYESHFTLSRGQYTVKYDSQAHIAMLIGSELRYVGSPFQSIPSLRTSQTRKTKTRS